MNDRILNMAEAEKRQSDSLQFHEMEIDDRILKVSLLFLLHFPSRIA